MVIKGDTRSLDNTYRRVKKELSRDVSGERLLILTGHLVKSEPLNGSETATPGHRLAAHDFPTGALLLWVGPWGI